MRRARRGASGVNVGFVSLLMIFLTLCLVCFCVLALSTASADSALSKRSSAYTAAYYEADSENQKALARLDGRLLTLRREAGGNEAAYWNAVETALLSLDTANTYDPETHTVTFLHPAGEKSILEQTLRITGLTDGPRYVLLSCRTVPVTDDLGGQGENLWKGN